MRPPSARLSSRPTLAGHPTGKMPVRHKTQRRVIAKMCRLCGNPFPHFPHRGNPLPRIHSLSTQRARRCALPLDTHTTKRSELQLQRLGETHGHGTARYNMMGGLYARGEAQNSQRGRATAAQLGALCASARDSLFIPDTAACLPVLFSRSSSCPSWASWLNSFFHHEVREDQ